MTYSNLIGDRLVTISSEVGYLSHLVDTLQTLPKHDRNKILLGIHQGLARIEKELDLYETTLRPEYIGNIPHLHQKVLNLKYWTQLTSMAL